MLEKDGSETATLSKSLLSNWDKIGDLILEISQEHDAPPERILLVKSGGAVEDDKTMVDEISEQIGDSLGVPLPGFSQFFYEKITCGKSPFSLSLSQVYKALMLYCVKEHLGNDLPADKAAALYMGKRDTLTPMMDLAQVRFISGTDVI